MGKLPDGAHFSRPWRIHEIARDFDLEDVWALPTPGKAEDFSQLVELLSGWGAPGDGSRLSRLLFAIRFKAGELLGADDEPPGQPTLRDRLPADLAGRPLPATPPELPFRALYLLDDEFAAEIVNRTVHGVLHVGWVPDGGSGAYRGQMAVLVKPNGLLGRVYMAAITPFRYLVVYPSMLDGIGRAWRARTTRRAP